MIQLIRRWLGKDSKTRVISQMPDKTAPVMNLLGCNVLPNGTIPGTDHIITNIRLIEELPQYEALLKMEKSKLGQKEHFGWRGLAVGEIFIIDIYMKSNRVALLLLEKTEKSGKYSEGFLEGKNDNK